MIATNELRFVERTVKTPYGNDGAEVSKNVRILQQKWQERYWTFDEAGNKSQPEEWRDVPLAKEDTHTPTEPEFDAAIDAAINAKETDRG